MVRTNATALICLGLLLFNSSLAAAKLYRWVDDEGRVHYSDRVPAEVAGKARSQLNEQGLEVKKVEAAKTPEEIAREKELKRLRAEQKRLIEEQRAKDRVLLRTFRTEDDILMARNGKLAAIDVIIQVARSNIRRLKLKLADMQANAADLERRGEVISRRYLDEIESTRQQLKEGYASIIREERQKEVIRQKFSQDLQRFRKLKNLREEQSRAVDEPRRRSLLDTVVLCNDEPTCNRAWQQAERYVRKHATTRLQMLSDSIIMAAAPLTDKDISLTVSRIRKPGRPGAELFMDLQCKNSPRGNALCQSEEVERIRLGFRDFVRQAISPQ